VNYLTSAINVASQIIHQIFSVINIEIAFRLNDLFQFKIKVIALVGAEEQSVKRNAVFE